MRVSPRELRGIKAEGLLTRFAILGPVAFVTVEIPAAGSAGTGAERRTEDPAWGIVLRGSISLHGPAEQSFSHGTAFHVPAGPPEHWFSAPGRAVIAGFVPMAREVDTSDEGIRALGFEPVSRMAAPPPPPAIIAPAVGGTIFRSQGSIEVESALMGEWVFSRTTYGPLSGYTSGWCDLPHWGMVLSGDLALRFETGVELLSTGDVYYCPPGPPGHQFQVADAATTIDYTPASDLFGRGRKSEWRAAAARRVQRGEAVTAGGSTRGGAGAGGRSKAATPPRSLHETGQDPRAGERPDAVAAATRARGGSTGVGVRWVGRTLLRPVRAGLG